MVLPEGLGTFKNSPHRVLKPRPYKTNQIRDATFAAKRTVKTPLGSL
jgi:hypothetical protein